MQAQQTHMDLSLEIRWLGQGDFPEVIALEQDCFPQPWTPDQFSRCVSTRGVLGMVAECECGCRAVHGYVIFSVTEHRYDILNLAVRRQIRRQGVGRLFIDRLLANAERNGISTLRAVVRETNLAAQLFFRGCGFRAVDVLKKEFKNTDESAYLFVQRVPVSAREVERR